MASSGKNFIRLFAPDESQSWVFPVLFEDDHYLALDKMSHMAITHSQLHPDRQSLDNLIRRAIGEMHAGGPKRGIRHLPFACRIDFETSGIALFCKSNEAKQKIGDLLGANREQREFQCLVTARQAATRSGSKPRLAGCAGGRNSCRPAIGGRMRELASRSPSVSPVSRCSTAGRRPTESTRSAHT
ncbi:MAG: hypothetical protein CM1200mP34_2280 [Verrucomicrobiales bacterium]|nr:MAG: hypothetical protein CM1200mP34_2280 [Verrucomicrobiales bacterium]